MASLYKTAETARKAIIGFLIFSIAILVIDILGRGGTVTVQQTTLNSCYMDIDNLLGPLAPLQLNSLEVGRENATYALEGIYGLFPNVAYAYSIERPREKLLVFETAQEVVESLGFDPKVFTDLGNNNFEWVSRDETRSVTFNKTTQKWKLTTKFDDNNNAIRRKTLARNLDYYSNQLGRLISLSGWDVHGLDSPQILTRFAKLQDGIFEEKTTPQESDYVFAEAFRQLEVASVKPDEELPANSRVCETSRDLTGFVYGEDPRKGQISALVSEDFSDYENELYSLDFTNFEYSSKRGVYPIIKPDEAWNQIQQGKGSIVSILPQNYNYFADYPRNLAVRRFTADRSKTMLAYYEPSEWSGLVYPIYIFEGRAELVDGRIATFKFYVEAIKR